ncbi:MAG: HAD family hydrolase [Deinococcus sp.]|nr:HAD family hydrolase [Deinococcus sp.]
MPHALEVLRELKNRSVGLGLVTNGWPQRAVLAACGLSECFGVVVVSGEVGFGKPDPRSYQLALDARGVTAAGSWFVGDSPRNDVWGPQQLGLRSVWLPTGHPLAGERPEVTLQDLRGVLHLF